MNKTSFRFQLQQVDLALLALIQERARLCDKAGGVADDVAMEDLMRRADGSVSGKTIGEIFAKLNERSAT